MCRFKVIIQKGDVSDNTGSVGKESKLIGIAEMAIDVELLCVREGCSL